LLFYQLLHNPDILSELVAEIDTQLPPLAQDEPSHSISLLEASLPYLRNCIKENFRINPVFTMPLARRITAEEGIVIDGEHIKQGTSIAICNHAFHHNPAVWGSDHNTFRPSRWNEPATSVRSRLLMHFGLGARQCIGKTIATTNIYKLTTGLLKDFEFELLDNDQTNNFDAKQSLEGSKNDVPDMVSVGISDLEAPLFVRCRQRSTLS